MKTEGNAGVYSTGTRGIDVPKYGSAPRRTTTPKKPVPTGLNWDALRPAQDTPSAPETPHTARCKGCRTAGPTDDLQDGYCPTCVTAIEERHVDDTRLGRDLATLEATDPKVRESADSLADTVDRITHPEDHAHPPKDEPCPSSTTTDGPTSTHTPSAPAASVAAPTSTPASTSPAPSSAETSPAAGSAPTSAPAAPDPNLEHVLVELRALRGQLTVELKRVQHVLDMVTALLVLLPPAPAAVSQPETPTAPSEPTGTTDTAAGTTRRTPRRRDHAGVRQPAIALPVDEIVRRYQAGETRPQLAAAYGVLPKRITTELQRAGIELRDDRARRSGSRHKDPSEDDPELVDNVRRLYIDEQHTQAQVGEALGITSKLVQNIMARHDIPARPKNNVRSTALTDEPVTVAHVRALYEQGKSQSYIASEYGVSQITVSKFMRRHGLRTRPVNFRAAVAGEGDRA